MRLDLNEKELPFENVNAVILLTDKEFPSEKLYLKNGFSPLTETIVLAK